jgi:hypothetical protein
MKSIFQNSFKLLLLNTFVIILFLTDAQADQVYFNDFNSGTVGPEWTSSLGIVPMAAVPLPNGNYNGNFLGEMYGNNSLTLSLNVSGPGEVELSFDTYFIRSWDGNDTKYGPDSFIVSVIGGPTLLNNTFSNGNPAGQSYVGNGIQAPEYQGTANNSMEGSVQQRSLGYYFYDGLNDPSNYPGYGMSSVYDFDFSFYTTSNTIQIQFAGNGLQDNFVLGPDGTLLPYRDETWGIDNVGVDFTPVPEPSSLILFAVAGFGLFYFSWKNKKRGTDQQ